MALDSLTLTVALKELAGELEGARIDKIQQPERDVLLFTVRTNGGNRKLLISAGGGSARLHFTTISRENPAAPPMFCMLLRKHLTGARIISLEQPYLERMCVLRMEVIDQLGQQVSRKLVVEMMGRSANIILCDDEDRIIDCIRKVDADMSDKRQVLPGLFYRMPPGDGKADLFTMSKEELTTLCRMTPGDVAVERWLRDSFTGLSPLVCREAAYVCTGATDTVFANAPSDLPERLMSFAAGVLSDTAPYILWEDDTPVDISCIPIQQYGALRQPLREPSYSVMLDRFFTGTEQARRVAQRAQTLVKTITSLRDRAARKLLYQAEELKKTEDRERLRQFGDIIQANLYQMERGARSLTAEDFYAPEPKQVVIPLDPKLSPRQNAERYYKRYTKAKNARIVLAEQMAEGQRELEYLESVLEELERASGERDLEDIRAELTEGGYIREKNQSKKPKQTANAPLRFVSSTGLKITVGRNNTQNDTLTFKTAFRGDLWLHTQKLHGSHVIVSAETDEVDDTTLLEAASLAAYYSQGKNAGAVDVDYTAVRNVKKPSGAKPGMVIYTNYKTIRVKPDPALVERLIKK